MADRKIVLVTGATGKIGRVMVPLLAATERYELRSGHRREDPAEVAHLPNPVYCRLDQPASLAAACVGVDTIVHLAADSWMPDNFADTVPNNLLGPHYLCEAALAAGVRRIVFASTNHTILNWITHSHQSAPEDIEPRPDNLYGVTKVYGEAMGRYYVECRGLPSFFSLRIGWYQRADSPGLRRNWHGLHMWLSDRDGSQLLARCIDSDLLGYHCFNAVSGNTRTLMPIDRARDLLGYAPEDDAERFAAEFTGPMPEWFAALGEERRGARQRLANGFGGANE
ncbi:MAG: NAD(P)-dependent oxidoreductase [Armatimonadetes bacterium]|nr:NAD(P)-dependent oxidoreductase [Armatimonadota bacterium]